MPNEPASTDDDDLGLADFQHPTADVGISLDQLSQAYADLVDRGHDPYAAPSADTLDDAEAVADTADEGDAASDAVADVEISPQSILEAMLFVGTPDNTPLTGQQIASLMRGVRPDEIDDLVGQLNAAYRAGGDPFCIVASGQSYRMTLRDEYRGLRDNFYGRIKEARLSQSAIDVLAIVAYNQPLTQRDVDQMRGKPSGGVLSQLVRRQLLRIERPEATPRAPTYHTTDRFLQLFGIATLDDLPRTQ